MSTRHLIDPELLPLLDNFVPVNEDTFLTVRASMAELVAANLTAQQTNDAVTKDERVIELKDHNLRILIIAPATRPDSAPAILHIHGGGMVVGVPEMWLGTLCQLVEDLQCVIVSVDYRLAPETPFPGPLEDCYATLSWLFNHANALSVDSGRIAIMGESAGGGLAAALALYTRDQGEFKPLFQQLSCPMLDDRTAVRSNPFPNTGEFIWTADTNAFGWRSLLNCDPGTESVSPYASPARAQDLSGLPHAMMYVGELDLFLYESLDYAQRLIKAGVSTEMHVYPRAFHGFEMLPESRLAQTAYRDMANALKSAFNFTN